MSTQKVAAAVFTVALVLGGTACGKVADKVANKATEKAIESQSGGNVDLDTKDGKLTVKTKDGETTYGTVTKLPDQWPDEISFPKGTKLISSTTAKQSDGVTMSVGGVLKGGDGKAIAAKFASTLDDAGYEIENQTEGDYGGAYSSQLTAVKGDSRVAVIVSDAAGEGVSMSVTVTPSS